MNRWLWSFYAAAVAFHAAVLFLIHPPAVQVAQVDDKTYIDIAISAPTEEPAPTPVIPAPPVDPEKKPLPPEPKPEPVIPPPPKPEPAEMPVPLPPPAPEPPPKAVVPQPVANVPKPDAPKPYVALTEPSYAARVEPVYPLQARRKHQQGTVLIAIYIGESGVLDKLEILKSSGYPLLDQAAADALKQSRFLPAKKGSQPVRSRAEVKVTFRLE